MKEIKNAQERKALNRRPRLTEKTATLFDDLFWGHLDVVKAAAEHDNELEAIKAALIVQAVANTIWGFICLGGAPLANGLWREWAIALLKIEMELVQTGTPAARQAHRVLLSACTIAFTTAREQ